MIYFAVWPESEWLGGTVKIGYTRDLPKREKELGAEFVDAILGDAFDESYLHKTLRPFRAHQQIGRCEYYAMFPAIEVLLHLQERMRDRHQIRVEPRDGSALPHFR